jgi:hypothetical protein
MDDQQFLIKEFLDSYSIAVVGSFRNQDKYAYKIFKKLKCLGYQVYPVNPSIDYLEGSKCYKNISSIPDSLDAADIVTPPHVTERILKECKDKGVKKVWLQPGAESKAAVNYCRDNNILVIYNLCLMLNTDKDKGGTGG